MATLIRQPAGEQALRLAVTQIRDVKVRDASGTGDGSWTIEGYAAVFEQETVLFEIAGWWRLREELARGAFSSAEHQPTSVLDRLAAGTELVHLNHGHDMKTAMAASDVTGIGGLELAEDFHGLRFFARVDPEDPDARALAVKMGRGVVKQASFCFTVAAEERTEVTELEDGTHDEKWRILEVGHLYDVCCCAQGAYAQTESHLRSLAAASLRTPALAGALGRSSDEPSPEELEALGRGRRAPERAGGSDIAPADQPVGEAGSFTALERLQRETSVATRLRLKKGE